MLLFMICLIFPKLNVIFGIKGFRNFPELEDINVFLKRLKFAEVTFTITFEQELVLAE